MDTPDQFQADVCLEQQREILTRSLNEIATEIGMTLRDSGLDFPIFIPVREDGDALATIATPLDPSDEDWQRASTIVCQIIISKAIGCEKLRGRPLACAIARSTIAAADVTGN